MDEKKNAVCYQEALPLVKGEELGVDMLQLDLTDYIKKKRRQKKPVKQFA